ncbi:CoA-transferase [Marinomonas sp. SBI22]|uniref:CaiB/BaiF CoA transferase family protein n=1 Tax=unclassified Marinomonas TaxID=196814 RepID=UPI0007AF9D26|nr:MULTISPECIES: CaiB/BaiF CoA-transferase family protein [unclassified Marinomonas]KZM42449.1 CoA-transferase [Marinomonas sp. SBI22]KZM43843.1 CoA-transferase [Marinomonas sp. SBI8L]
MKTPLENIRVLDLSRVLAGPWASQMLADMGAHVIKVERPKKGDDTRFWGPPFIKEASADQPPQAAYFHCANRNKESIAIDIRTQQGQAVIKSLIACSDVLIENYKVGGLAKYGLDYETVHKLNPRLVYCSITGFGQSGPSAHKAGYDAMIQGEGGLMSLTGEPDGEPMKVGVALVDVMTGLYASNGILAALMARHTTQLGQHLDIALLDVQMATLANQGMNYLASGENPKRQGNGHPNIVPYQTFATQDGNVILAIGNDEQFAKFCTQAKLGSLLDNDRFKTNEQRVIHRDKLIPIIASRLAEETMSFWIESLEQVAVPCGAVNTLDKVFNHPQLKHRKMVRELPDKKGVKFASIVSPINLSSTPLCYKSAPPDLGQDSQKILQQTLGLEQDEIQALFESGAVG